MPEDPKTDTTRPDTHDSSKRRVVVVVGRPNVGKSAIFNRIASRRIAIVHDQAGVTRDRIFRQVVWQDETFELVDTGGVNLQGGGGNSAIDAGIIEQVKVALEEAATAILAVDAQTGLTPVDEEVARMVRKSGVSCRVAVNKCDLPQHESQISEFEKLGFEIFPVSAQHDRGFGALMSHVVAALPDVKEETIDNPLKVAVVGRPNAGKSSYINRLLRQPRLIVSEIAGTTRDNIEVPFSIGAGEYARHYRLIDTAGMRHVHSIDNAVERFSHFRAESAVCEADIVVLMIDAEIGPTVQDKRIAARIAKEHKSCVILVNKWDMAHERLELTDVTETQYEPALRAAMPFMTHCPIVFISAKSGYNIRRSLEVIDEVAAQTCATLPTGILNRVLADAVAAIKPPSRGRKHFKLFYATQTGKAPTRVRLFINDIKIPTDNYTSYLIKAIRAAFGLEGTPVVINYRERSRPDDGLNNDSRQDGGKEKFARTKDERDDAKRNRERAHGNSEKRRKKSDAQEIRGKRPSRPAVRKTAGASQSRTRRK